MDSTLFKSPQANEKQGSGENFRPPLSGNVAEYMEVGRALDGGNEMAHDIPKNTSPPVDGLSASYAVKDLGHYAAGVLLLFAIWFLAVNFSFPVLHSRITHFRVRVASGGQAVVRNIYLGMEVAGRNARLAAARQGRIAKSRWEEFTRKEASSFPSVLGEKETITSQAVPAMSSQFAADKAGDAFAENSSAAAEPALDNSSSAARAVETDNERERPKKITALGAGFWKEMMQGIIRAGSEFGQGTSRGRSRIISEFNFWVGGGGKMLARGFAVSQKSVVAALSTANRQLAVGVKQARNWNQNLFVQQKPAQIFAARDSSAGKAAGDSETAPIPLSAPDASADLYRSATSTSGLVLSASTTRATAASSSEIATSPASSLPPSELGKKYLDWLISPDTVPLGLAAYRETVAPVRLPLNQGLQVFAGLGADWGGNIRLAWEGFFDRLAWGDSADPKSAAYREKLKQEIIREMQADNQISIRDGSGASMFSDSGIVVMKPTGSTTIDLANVKKLQDSFSDRVIVDFDKDGNSGFIRPLFRDRVGEKYLFVITPIRK